MIGSRSKLKTTREKLLADGFSDEDFDRVHAPIGLAIKAVTPEEIAISIAAQLIMERAPAYLINVNVSEKASKMTVQ